MVNDELWKRRYGKDLHSEEDVKNKIILPYLQEELGYSLDEMRFENPIPVQVGSKKITVYSDIEILIDGKPQVILDIKKPNKTLSEADILQSVSYAKLVGTPSALYGFATNGTDLKGINSATGIFSDKIPTKNELIAELQKTNKKQLSEIELNEVKSTLMTILSVKDLYRVIKKCKTIIEQHALIRSDQSFKEMTKIILVKMNEERRASVENKQNRFNSKYLHQRALANGVDELTIFKDLFQEAISKYTGIYKSDDPGIQMKDNFSLVSVVESLEPFSLLGTGEDIKGVVYETFLKANLRGDFDQYFTPRQIVDFMVKLADPKYNEKFVDPAAGSGGFLVRAFQYVCNNLKAGNLAPHEYEQAIKNLVDTCIWGQEADYDLHVLTKINMIMHGDGWNNIKQGDSLKTDLLPENSFDIVLENPPFTTLYTDKSVLNTYELGHDRNSQELDILFIEKSIKLLKEGGKMLIVIPEGLLNLPKYKDFRVWLLSKVFILSVCSLPAGAFQPFGRSASKTAILEVRKKGVYVENPKYVYASIANNIGYEPGKSEYHEIQENDFQWILDNNKEFFYENRNYRGSKCGWVPYELVSDGRIDASGLLAINNDNVDETVRLGDLFYICSESEKIRDNKTYNYVQVPYISDYTGILEKIDFISGNNIKASSLNFVKPGDIFFTRINPRKRRIGMVPTFLDSPIYVSNEVYSLQYRENKYLNREEMYIIIPILRSEELTEQIMMLSTGSSSSRARINIKNVENLEIPIKFIKQAKRNKDFSLKICDTSNEILKLIIEYEKNIKI